MLTAVCQSCGRQIQGPGDFGTNAHGERVTDYCNSCFARGKFVDRDLDVESQIDRTTEILGREFDLPPPRARAAAMQLVPRLGRWWMSDLLGRRWWTLVVRGVLAIVFGALVLAYPGQAILAISLLFGIWVFVDGIFSLGHAFEGSRAAWMFAVRGIFGIAVGVLTVRNPAITALALYTLVGIWAIVVGVFEFVSGVQLQRQVRGQAWLILAGISSAAFGVLLLVLPRAGFLALIWLIGIYGIVLGILTIGLGFRAHRLARRLERPIQEPTVRRPEPQPV